MYSHVIMRLMNWLRWAYHKEANLQLYYCIPKFVLLQDSFLHYVTTWIFLRSIKYISILILHYIKCLLSSLSVYREECIFKSPWDVIFAQVNHRVPNFGVILRNMYVFIKYHSKLLIGHFLYLTKKVSLETKSYWLNRYLLILELFSPKATTKF